MEIKLYSRRELYNKCNEILEKGCQEVDDLDFIIDCMLFYIGDVEAALRDQTIYGTFCYLIIESDCLSKDKCKELLRVVCDNDHLFYKIGNVNDDTVLTRSFSILVVAVLLYRNQQDSFLDPADFLQAKEAVFTYFEKECDYRGYDQRVGWIHAIAHGADAVDEVVKNDGCTSEDCQRMLKSGVQIFTNSQMIFAHEEDERFATAIQSMKLKNLISDDDIDMFKKQLIKEIKPNDYASYVSYLNGKKLIRSLIFKLKSAE